MLAADSRAETSTLKIRLFGIVFSSNASPYQEEEATMISKSILESKLVSFIELTTDAILFKSNAKIQQLLGFVHTN